MDPEDEVIEVEQENLEENQEVEQGEVVEEVGTKEAEESSEDDDVVVSIEGEAPPQEEEEERTAKPWVKQLRQERKDLQKEVKELRRKLEEKAQPDSATIVGNEPTLAECEYDEVAYKEKYAAYLKRKLAAEEQAEKKRKEIEDQQTNWQKTINAYEKAKAGLKIKDFDEAEQLVRDTLSPTQQALILEVADTPEAAALLVVALGKNPAKLKEVASIQSLAKFTGTIAKLETKVKVTPRKVAPAPEREVKGGGSTSSAVDSTLDRLRAEADKTGDRTKVAKYLKAKQGK